MLIFEANRDRPLKDVQSKAQMIYANLVDAIESLADEDLNNPANFRGMPADWIPWKIIAENAYEHYQQHLPDLQVWLTEQTGAMVE